MCFKCKGCGDCCRNFNEKNKCIPLFSWEVERLKKISKEKNIKIEFKPIKYLLDENSGIVFVYLYGIKNNICPFLIENECSIHNEKPLICQQFPLFWTASFNPKQEFGASCFSYCKYFECKQEFEKYFLGEENVSNKDIDLYLKETYGNCFNSASIGNKVCLKILEIIKKHDLSNEFKLKEIPEKELENYKIFSLIDFLKFKKLNQDIRELEMLYYQKTPQH